jgi:hypothetical protein
MKLSASSSWGLWQAVVDREVATIPHPTGYRSASWLNPRRGNKGAACRLDDDLPLPGLLVGPQRSGRIGYSGAGLVKRNGGKVTRPRAADDFATIRARIEELRRERAQILAEREGRRKKEGM